MERKTLAARLDDDLWARLDKEPGETYTERLANLIRRAPEPETARASAETVSAPATDPPASAQDDGDAPDPAALRAENALLRALAAVATPGSIDRLLPTLAGLVEAGPGGEPQIGGAPITAAALSELIPATMQATRGTGGGGGHAHPEARTPAKPEPDPSGGLFRFAGDGAVRIDTAAYSKLDDAEKRAVQLKIMANSR